MSLEDLQYIFDRQIEEGTEMLYFMLADEQTGLNMIQRHPADDLAGLLPMLDSFQYTGHTLMPRFVK
jgi:hypothetical protein